MRPIPSDPPFSLNPTALPCLQTIAYFVLVLGIALFANGFLQQVA